MTARIKIQGPPGTGKTTTLQKLMHSALHDEEAPLRGLPNPPAVKNTNEIAFISFTNSAIDEIAQREYIPARTKKARYFRTLHGILTSLLLETEKLNKNKVPSPHKVNLFRKQFAEKHGYAYSTNVFAPAEGNRMFAEYTKAIEKYLLITGGDPIAALAQIEDREARKFALNYHAHKLKHGFIDFDDILLLALKNEDDLYAPVIIAMIDEAQDLGPLDHHLVNKLFEGTDYLVLAGDPLQSIYGFKGADPRLFTKAKGKEFTLDTTFRLAQKIWAISRAWGFSTTGILQPYYPHPQNGLGRVALSMPYPQALKYAIQKAREGKKVMILVRTNNQVLKITEELLTLGAKVEHIKHEVEALKNAELLLEALRFINNPDRAPPREVLDFLARRSKNNVLKDLFTRIKTTKTLDVEAYSLLQYVQKHPARYIRASENEIKLAKLLSKQKAITTTPLLVDTFHASKGSEADVVLVMNYASKAVLNNKKNNYNPHRIEEKLAFYVAMTRAREELIFVEAPDPRYYEPLYTRGELLEAVRLLKQVQNA